MNRILIRLVHSALNQAIAVVLLSGVLALPARAWSDHASLVWPLLRSQPELVQQTVAAEPLDAFLMAEQAGIAKTLGAVDSWSVATIEHYPPTPEDLRWGTGHPPTAERFGRSESTRCSLSPTWISPRAYPAGAGTAGRFELFGGRHIATGRALLGAGAGRTRINRRGGCQCHDEPDFGMDIGLFSDNGTDFGQRYGLVSNLLGTLISSTVPRRLFTWGLSLDWLSRAAQPSASYLSPVANSAFGELAELAFSTGHEYGWRFRLGPALRR